MNDRIRRLLERSERGGLHLGAEPGAAPGDMEIRGLALGSLADGRLRVTLEQLVLHRLRLQAGDACIDIERLALNGATLTLALPGPGAAAGIELLGVSAREIELQGVQAQGPGALDGPRPAGPWRLDAVGGMDGLLHVFVTDAAWIIDADVRLPVSGGRLDFNRVVVEHIGPNSSMGISPAGLYIDAPRVGRSLLYLFTGGPIPGASFERRIAQHASRVSDRGALDLQAFLQGLLDREGGAQLGRAADRHVEARLDRTRLQGELRLGDGLLGTERQHLVLHGREEGAGGDGPNRVEVSAAVLGHRLVLRMPRLSASRAAFELPGLAGTTGPVSATGLKVEATRPRTSSCRPRLRLEAGQVTVQRLVLGDVEPPASDPPDPPRAGGG